MVGEVRIEMESFSRRAETSVAPSRSCLFAKHCRGTMACELASFTVLLRRFIFGYFLMTPRLYLACICICVLSAVLASSSGPTVLKQFVVPKPPWPYAHVCSLTEQANGDVVATWQAGSGEKNPDSSIWMSTRSESVSFVWFLKNAHLTLIPGM